MRVGKRDPNFAETVGSGEGRDAEALRAMHLVGSEIDTLQVVTVVVRYPQRSARGICVERLLADRDPLDDFLRVGIHADDAPRLRQDDPERAHALRHAHRLAADRKPCDDFCAHSVDQHERALRRRGRGAAQQHERRDGR